MRGLPALLPVLSLALAQTVIPFWHTAGPPGDRVLEEAIRSFNAGQNATGSRPGTWGTTARPG